MGPFWRSPLSFSGWLSPTAEENDDQSGRRESNPQQQLGRLRQYHFATPARSRPVGAAGLEPATSASQTQRASRLRHAPRSTLSIPASAALVKPSCRVDAGSQVRLSNPTPAGGRMANQANAVLGRPGEALHGPAGKVGPQGDHQPGILAARAHEVDAPTAAPVGDKGDGRAVRRPGGQTV